jgi:hypothetical protein
MGGKVEVNDALQVFWEILKARFTRVKKFIIGSSVLGFSLGLVAGLIAYYGDQNSEYSLTQTTLIENILQFSLGYGIGAPLFLILAITVFSIFWFPADIAKRRGHAYTSIIQILTIAGLFSVGILWLAAAIWAIYPSEKSLIDPIAGNPTGLGRRNAGDTIGAAIKGSTRGMKFEKDTDKEIDSLIDMRAKGLISDEEFMRKKQEILKREY